MSSSKATIICDSHSAVQVERSITGILDRSSLCSLATTTGDGKPYINTCFFAYDSGLRLYILTPPKTIHAQNILRSPAVALAVYDSQQVSGSELQGIQIFGDCRQATSSDDLKTAFATYATRFGTLKSAAKNVEEMLRVFESRLFIVTSKRVKVFDEPTFGKETWVVATIQ
jgi:uncharacterized protein YhbP (UPF0306 family)